MSIKSEKNFDIKNLTSFKIGGKIDEVFFPENIDELVQILKDNPGIKVFGNLSNTLISSLGYKGKIILTTKMSTIKIDGNKIVADCGVKGPKLSQTACENSLSGFEFMIGFPGSVGGEVYMNASAHGQCISDKLTSVTCLHQDGKITKYSKTEMEFDYRNSRCPKDNLIVLQAEFELETKPQEEIKSKMNENLEFRKTHQPLLNLPNCGSIFKNPPQNSAGKLLDSVGAKSFTSGGVRVWENHANFIVNSNNGTSTDILNLMNKMFNEVKNEYSIELQPEIIYLGTDKKENELWQTMKK
ncbi:MAG: UDP-N-acetylmuramate dehydrogenase [Muribaculaceae bacterium]|nr:UDP-N-acetylmuramate dehydrogenase [Muribaculaceae bacterium]